MMMRQLSPTYFVSPQIEASDIPALKEAGITRILCNRPDGEVPPPLQSAAIGAAAQEAGLAFDYCPLTHQSMVPDVIAQNSAMGAGTDDTVLAYCASGTRSTIAWALGQAGERPADEIVSAAAAGGYDIANMRPLLEKPFR